MTDSVFTAVWDSPRFRQLLASGMPGPALALVRKQMGLSQADFGELLHWDRTHAGRVERGEVGTIFDVRELVRAADALGIPRSALMPLLLGDSDAGTIDGGEGEGVDDVDRRQFVQAATVAVAATGAAADLPWSDPTRVGTGHIAYLRTVTQQLWEHDNQFGSGAIVDFAIQQYRLARRLLDHGEYGVRTGAELARAAGWLSNTAAWLSFDCGRTTLAWHQLSESVLLAEQCDDNELLAAALGDLTNMAVDSPTASREPVRLARRSSELVRGVPSVRLNAWRAVEEARAYAAVGDASTFEKTLTRVWREADRGLDSQDDPAWLDCITEAELRVWEAKGRKLLGQHHRAVALCRESVGRAGNLPRDEASYRAYFAASLAGLGEFEAAIATGHTALSLLEGPVSSLRLVRELRPVRIASARSGGDDAEHFRFRFDSLCGSAAGQG
ncbi:helix-turn-helix domain-containing protein [Nocardia sp. NBC_00881]|uniref:helix-turn-helix domain-containing protein n=1 Tax=Nocardia sp. NBC_00881 TaxID=2975995 RepID=UPI00386FFD59|nr:helix-turn-helix domain-containing protein [Nocardia sp. NBC_00881]